MGFVKKLRSSLVAQAELPGSSWFAQLEDSNLVSLASQDASAPLCMVTSLKKEFEFEYAVLCWRSRPSDCPAVCNILPGYLSRLEHQRPYCGDERAYKTGPSVTESELVEDGIKELSTILKSPVCTSPGSSP